MLHQEKLAEMAKYSSKRQTVGLESSDIELFAKDSNLAEAINLAYEQHCALRGSEFAPILRLPEAEQIQVLQEQFLNFYPSEGVNPYIPLAAKGPWIVTSCGAVIHDSGGYGMLGFGHDPSSMQPRMDGSEVMANVMTASFAQKRFTTLMQREIGHTRSVPKTPIYDKFLCLNSGSEAVSVALRISDINAKMQTESGKHKNRKIKLLSLSGSFHGRTEGPAQVSDSSIKVYKQHLASFRDRHNLVTVTPNDEAGLREAFARADAHGEFFEACLLEPVMGEGDPGKAITPSFYATMRELSAAHSTIFIVDSIQAGLRAHGCLSIVDYPGFGTLPPPDIEVFSKALNAGQYPLSVLGLREAAAKIYVRGVYGNTMTTNPRALHVGCAVLQSLTPELRSNIVNKGREFVEKFKALASRYPKLITDVQGTGLIFSCAITSKLPVVGNDGMETQLRKKGIGVIHGGANSLRFTPIFAISSPEIDLVVRKVEEVIKTY